MISWGTSLLGLLALVFAGVLPAWADAFLPPEQAFALSVQGVEGDTVRLHWAIAPGYHLYRDRLSISSSLPGVRLAPLKLPPAKEVFDENFKASMAVYDQSLQVEVHVVQGGASVPVTVAWQGCADAGLCYAPTTALFDVALTRFGAAQNLVVHTNEEINTRLQPVSTDSVATDSIAIALASGSWLRTIGVFWLAGLLLAFTPCVLPMVPILSSLIAGQTAPVGRGKGLALSLAYSFGMALVYAGFGVAAGLAGEGLAAALQTPWVLGAFALLLSGLALSMLGVYELQLPSALQSRAAQWSNRFQGGSLAGVFLMGGVSALVVGPCVAAPLAGALVYISQTRDVGLGGVALFAMAAGMSVPLLLVGASAGSLLPRAGAWMVRVKQVFGVMLLGVAVWTISPLLPSLGPKVSSTGLPFERVTSVQALDAMLAQSRPDGEAVMLDFYADWCVACKEFERFTFSDAAVRQRLRTVRLLQADVTANSTDDTALMKRFGLFGPPGIVFLDVTEKARVTHTVVGYQNAAEFIGSLDQALPR